MALSAIAVNRHHEAMVFIAAILAILITVGIFAACFVVALLTAEGKRLAELQRLETKIDRLAGEAMPLELHND